MSIIDADKAIQDFYDHMWGKESKEVNGAKEVKTGMISYATDYAAVLYKNYKVAKETVKKE